MTDETLKESNHPDISLERLNEMDAEQLRILETGFEIIRGKVESLQAQRRFGKIIGFVMYGLNWDFDSGEININCLVQPVPAVENIVISLKAKE